MSKPVKEQITDNLDRVKDEGKLRSENIRGLISDAASLTVSELKEGTEQMRSILKDAIAAVVSEQYGDRYTEVKQQLDSIKDLYDRAKGEAETSGITSIQSKQTEIERKLSKFASAVVIPQF